MTSIRSVRSRTLAVASALCLVGAAAGCGSSSSRAANGGPVTLTIEGTPTGPLSPNFNPYSETSQFASIGAAPMIYEPLLMFNPLKYGEVHPWLASAYSFSPDGKTLTFTIRQGVTWSDGQPFTAQDVAFTLNMIKKYPSMNLLSAQFSSVTVQGNQVIVKFTQPGFSQLYNIGDTYIAPEHIWGSVANPSSYGNTHPIGTGPYVLESSSAQDMILAKNPHYWQPGLPKVSKLDFVAYDSNTSANLALEQGQLDWAANFVPHIQSLFVSKSPSTNHYWFPPYVDTGMMLNLTQSRFANVDVRKAISDALDRQAIVAAGEENEEPPAQSPTGLALPTQASSLAPQYKNLTYHQNIPAAKALLAQAGYHPGSNGVLVGPDGKPFDFTIQVPGSFTDAVTDLQVVAQQLRQVGIDATIDPVSLATWAVDMFTAKYDATYGPLSASVSPDPFQWYDTVLNGALTAPVGKVATGDEERWNDPATNALLAQYVNATTQAQRQTALDGLQSIMVNDLPVIPFLEQVDWSEYSSAKVTGWPSPSDPYAPATPETPSAEYVVLHLTPTK